jgi:hypothetical protein
MAEVSAAHSIFARAFSLSPTRARWNLTRAEADLARARRAVVAALGKRPPRAHAIMLPVPRGTDGVLVGAADP